VSSNGNWGWFGQGFQNDPEAKRIVDLRVGWLREKGWRLRLHWDRKAPLGIVKVEGGSYYVAHEAGLLDHLYRLVSPSGEVVYVTEPYEFYGFDEIAHLDGWDVSASATAALWYPGHTIAVRFQREKP
jgi:hypothetical protein